MKRKQTPITWEQIIDTPYLHGYRATVGNRTCEVVRAYSGEWFAHAMVNGRPCKPLEGFRGNEPMQSAKARGARFLRGGPCEVWP